MLEVNRHHYKGCAGGRGEGKAAYVCVRACVYVWRADERAGLVAVGRSSFSPELWPVRIGCVLLGWEWRAYSDREDEPGQTGPSLFFKHQNKGGLNGTKIPYKISLRVDGSFAKVRWYYCHINFDLFVIIKSHNNRWIKRLFSNNFDHWPRPHFP